MEMGAYVLCLESSLKNPPVCLIIDPIPVVHTVSDSFNVSSVIVIHFYIKEECVHNKHMPPSHSKHKTYVPMVDVIKDNVMKVEQFDM
jgi:hypothetical protein